MNKIMDNQEVAKQMILSIAKGNPGAMSCLIGLINNNPTEVIDAVLTKIANCDILGTDLYVYWSDLCQRDYNKMYQLALECPDDVLKDACGRQDYSGRALVEKYFNQ